jgi:hypothetical protein
MTETQEHVIVVTADVTAEINTNDEDHCAAHDHDKIT